MTKTIELETNPLGYALVHLVWKLTDRAPELVAICSTREIAAEKHATERREGSTVRIEYDVQVDHLFGGTSGWIGSLR